MACMHKETLKIYHNDQNILPEGYVELDEMIAPTIQVLNRKGYTTRFCCSGHPLPDALIRDPGGFHEAMSPWNSYIMFEEGITLPTLPPGYTARQVTGTSCLIIDKKFSIDIAYDFEFFEKAQEILDTMKQLYKWALGLPDFKTE